MSHSSNEKVLAVAIIGGGFGGLGMAYSLKQAGIEDFQILEKAAELGGTWRENTYPGAGCDVPSHFYSYSFESHYPWEWRYGKQSQILEYQNHVADKYDLRRHIRFGVAVESAVFDEVAGVWTMTLGNGETLQAATVVSAVGQLHRPAYPNINGLEDFDGPAFHSAHWDHSIDLTGKRVAVIGTGASAIQFVPRVAEKAKELLVFQRSPGWVMPKVESRFSPLGRWLLKHFSLVHDLDRLRIFLITELLAHAYNGNKLLEFIVTATSRLQIRWQVRDPELRRRVTPDFPVGCKRILLTSEWLPTLCQPHVSLISENINALDRHAVNTEDGQAHEVDVVIYGTGFKATEFLTPMKVTGRNGLDLHRHWKAGAEAYLGMTVAGFPNFHILYGPNTNVGSGSIIYMLERQQRYITQLIVERKKQGCRYADVKPAAQAAYGEEIQRRSDETTYTGDCQSWYKTADGRNTNNWVGSGLEFSRRLKTPVWDHFEWVK